MTTTPFSESLKYGGRLFGFFFLIVLSGGGAIALGAALTVPELQAVVDSGTTETAPLVGGLVLATLGIVVLAVGNFALVYKLIADAVARGLTLDSVVHTDAAPDGTVETDDDVEPNKERTAELGPSPGEQSAVEHGPQRTVPSGSGSAADEDQPRQSAPTQARESTPGNKAVREPKTEVTESAETRDTPSESGETGREQTAEEIAFGTGSQSSEESPEETDETAGESVPGGSASEPVEPREREKRETAGDSASDPLGERFDDE